MIKAVALALSLLAPVEFDGTVVKQENGYQVAQLQDGSQLWFQGNGKVGDQVEAYFVPWNTEDGLIKVVVK